MGFWLLIPGVGMGGGAALVGVTDAFVAVLKTSPYQAARNNSAYSATLKPSPYQANSKKGNNG